MIPYLVPVQRQPEVPRIGLRAGVAAPLNAAPVRALGFLSVLDGPKREVTVLLRNDGDTPLTLQAPRPTCRCTRAVFDRETVTLKPGQETRLRLTLDLTGLAPGAIVKGALILAEGESLPLAVVNVSGEIVAPVRLTSGALSLKDDQPVDVTAEIDARLLAQGKLPALVCSVPGVTVTPLDELAPLNLPGPARVRRTYRVRIAADAPAGPIRGVLGFSSEAPLWRAADIPVAGR